MQNKKIIHFVGSLVLFPLTSISLGNIYQNNNFTLSPEVVFSTKLNIEVDKLLSFNQEINLEALVLEKKAEAIDAYFNKHKTPLAGFGMKMVLEAEQNKIDWRLIPAIAMRESTGGIYACQKASFNPFGWGSCKIGFTSFEEAIEVVAKNLGGNNPNTARFYANKNTKEILQKYNPPSIVPKYADQVIKIMDTIGPIEIILDNQEEEKQKDNLA